MYWYPFDKGRGWPLNPSEVSLIRLDHLSVASILKWIWMGPYLFSYKKIFTGLTTAASDDKTGSTLKDDLSVFLEDFFMTDSDWSVPDACLFDVFLDVLVDACRTVFAGLSCESCSPWHISWPLSTTRLRNSWDNSPSSDVDVSMGIISSIVRCLHWPDPNRPPRLTFVKRLGFQTALH